MPGIYLASEDGAPITSANPLPTTATINAGDIEIGAVEIKDATTDARAVVDATFGLAVDVKRSVAMDTELPAAAALADATANPTTPLVGAALEGYNGTTWDRLRVDADKNLKVSLRNSSGVEPNISFMADGEGGFAGINVNGRGQLFNGTTWDRQRNNTQNTLLASAARTVTTSSPDQTNYNAKGLHVVLDVTVAGTGDITLTIEGKDGLSGKYYTLLAGTNVTTNSTNVYKVYPGLPATANVSANDIVPRTYRVTVTANNANIITYSVASLLNL